MSIRWRPDTCKCVLDYDGNGNTGIPIAVIPCEFHQGTPEEIGVSVKEENNAKNIAVMVAALSTATIYTVSEEDKRMLRMLARITNPTHEIKEIPEKIQHPDKGVDWFINPERKIVLRLTGFTQEDVDAINAEITVKLGRDRVITERVETPIP